MTKAEQMCRKRHRTSQRYNKRPDVRQRIRESTKKARKALRRDVARVREHRGDLIPTAYDVTAPTLHRRVAGLPSPRTRTVRINGFPLTLVETP